MASTTTSGHKLKHVHSGSTSTGTTLPCSSNAAACAASLASTAETPSTWVFPKRTASLNATVLRTVRGCGTSVITAEMPERTKRSAIALAISPAPRITASIETLPSKGFLPQRECWNSVQALQHCAIRRRFPPCSHTPADEGPRLPKTAAIILGVTASTVEAPANLANRSGRWTCLRKGLAHPVNANHANHVVCARGDRNPARAGARALSGSPFEPSASTST